MKKMALVLVMALMPALGNAQMMISVEGGILDAKLKNAFGKTDQETTTSFNPTVIRLNIGKEFDDGVLLRATWYQAEKTDVNESVEGPAGTESFQGEIEARGINVSVGRVFAVTNRVGIEAAFVGGWFDVKRNVRLITPTETRQEDSGKSYTTAGVSLAVVGGISKRLDIRAGVEGNYAISGDSGFVVVPFAGVAGFF